MRNGLTGNEVFKLREKFGFNILATKETYSWWSIFVAQLKSPFFYILMFAAIISFFFKEYTDVGLILFVNFLNVSMGFYQEYNAQKTLSALRKILKPRAKVIREGKVKEIEAKELVPGDLVVLSPGEQVPADGRIIESVNLLVQEAILTGEEEAVEKTLREENNSVFMGTIVLSGRGLMTVAKTGIKTEIGKIGEKLSEIKEEKTPLQFKLEKFSKSLAYIVCALCFFIFSLGIIHGESFWMMFRIAAILAVAAVPEGLPIAVTVILALGMRRILKRNGLVKKLLSIETLGATSLICTDKTGTLTEGNMRVVKTDFTDKQKALLALTLNNNQLNNLEVAVLDYVYSQENYAAKKVLECEKRIYEEPFTSDKKYMLTVNECEGENYAFIKGAPEIVLSFCRFRENEKPDILAEIEKWAAEGLKILGLAYKKDGDLKEKSSFVWLGLIGLEDPVREGVKESISKAHEAGIKVVMVTGDHTKTAEKIANNLGFSVKPENILEGSQLSMMSEEELNAKIDNILLFTRTTPDQKLRIVEAFQKKGEVVATIGDGVNDALALKKANIGVVGNQSTDVAKEAADLILLDGNFKTIIAACEEGRLIFSNIKKVVGYVLSNSFAEIFLIFGAILLNFPTPLLVAQILWIHLICDGPPDIALSFETKDKFLMKRKPKEIQKEEILDRPLKFLAFAISLTTGLLALLFFWYFGVKSGDMRLARTIAFATIAIDSLIFIFAFKNYHKLIFQMENFFQNKVLIISVVYGFLLIAAAISVPFLDDILQTVPLRPVHLLIILTAGLVNTFMVEMVKLKFKKARV